MRWILSFVHLLAAPAALAQQTISDEEYLVSLDAAADSCVFFAALNMLPEFNPSTARQVLEQVCRKPLDRLDSERCRLGPDSPMAPSLQEIDRCIKDKVYSSGTLDIAQNLMEMATGKR